MNSFEDYLKRFAKLRVDTSRTRWSPATQHCAPHKPFLLMAIMDLFAQGTITANLIEMTPDLGEVFTIYWSKLMPAEHHANLALPFFHLKSEGFWHLIPRSGKENFLAYARQIRSSGQLRDTIVGATLDEELYEFLCVAETRDLLRAVLLKAYFADEVQELLIQQSVINLKAFQYSQALLEGITQSIVKEQLTEEPYTSVRDQGFRRAVITAYDHRCALCGIRMLTPDGHTVLEAAHIVPWSLSHNDDPCNGLGLCRLCHWAFDEGLVGISSQYEVITSSQLTAENNIPGQLGTIEKRPIIGPSDKHYWPDVDALKWHRQNVFRKR